MHCDLTAANVLIATAAPRPRDPKERVPSLLEAIEGLPQPTYHSHYHTDADTQDGAAAASEAAAVAGPAPLSPSTGSRPGEARLEVGPGLKRDWVAKVRREGVHGWAGNGWPGKRRGGW